MSALIVSPERIRAEVERAGGDKPIPERVWKPKQASRCESLGARFTRDERVQIELAALKGNISPAAWLRGVALAALVQP